ncbi:GrpB family protein [Rhizobium bangladeshense]|uniref:GrpB family protein n=1 Tax=Rhizobium bangladeshense TaxID=1138189 RepID=UPI002486979C|nr:GrpB family protein [Rhizobium bangladeshense]
MRIEIEAPQQSWVEEFTTLKSAIMGAAPVGAYLHHIGSTAVSGVPEYHRYSTDGKRSRGRRSRRIRRGGLRAQTDRHRSLPSRT